MSSSSSSSHKRKAQKATGEEKDCKKQREGEKEEPKSEEEKRVERLKVFNKRIKELGPRALQLTKELFPCVFSLRTGFDTLPTGQHDKTGKIGFNLLVSKRNIPEELFSLKFILGYPVYAITYLKVDSMSEWDETTERWVDRYKTTDLSQSEAKEPEPLTYTGQQVAYAYSTCRHKDCVKETEAIIPMGHMRATGTVTACTTNRQVFREYGPINRPQVNGYAFDRVAWSLYRNRDWPNEFSVVVFNNRAQFKYRGITSGRIAIGRELVWKVTLRSREYKTEFLADNGFVFHCRERTLASRDHLFPDPLENGGRVRLGSSVTWSSEITTLDGKKKRVSRLPQPIVEHIYSYLKRPDDDGNDDDGDE